MAFQCSYVALQLQLHYTMQLHYDSHSRNQHGQMVANGQPVLLKFSQLSDLEKYIQIIYLLQENQGMHISKFNTLISLLAVIQVGFWETSITGKSLTSKWSTAKIKFRRKKHRAICHCQWQFPNPIQF